MPRAVVRVITPALALDSDAVDARRPNFLVAIVPEGTQFGFAVLELGAAEVGYTTQVTLRRDGDTWRPDWSPALVHPDLQEDERLAARRIAADRGEILGARGARLVAPRPIQTFGLDKSRIEPGQVRSSARAVARFLDVDVRGFVRLAEASGPKAFVEAIALRPDDAARVVGGARLGGGRGTLLGAILGIFLVAITENGLNLLGITPYAFKMIIGAIILIAITLSSDGIAKLIGSWRAPKARRAAA